MYRGDDTTLHYDYNSVIHTVKCNVHFKPGILQSIGSTVSAPLLLLFPTLWHCLYCFDPLLSFFSCSSLEEVVSLIRGDDLKEVAVNIVFFGWERGLKGMSGWKATDSKHQVYYSGPTHHQAHTPQLLPQTHGDGSSPEGRHPDTKNREERKIMWVKETLYFLSYFSLYKSVYLPL